MITALIFGGSANAANAEVKHADTVRYLASQFVNKKFIEGFTPGKADYNFTIESLLQLRAAGQTAKSFAPAVAHNLQNASAVGTKKNPVGLHFVDRKFQAGRGGMFLVASKAFALPKSSLRTSVLNLVKENVKPSGEVIDASGNSFTYAWVVMGLKAAGEDKLANLVATKLASLARPDGGFGTDLTGDTLTSASDSTGIALMALSAVKKSGSVTTKAVEWLNKSLVEGNHFEAWGEVDVNGTAYAVMGLTSAGQKVAPIQKWLVSRLAPKGGLISAWSEGKADKYATAQGYIALLGSNYLALFK